ncbi:MAG: YlxR family protein [Clostridia bacterium]|nr:YlxR family protein [Clostridia bacterium]
MRKCVGCNEMKDKKELIRIVRSSEGVMNVDVTGKMSGRGAYICKCLACFDSAVKAKRLERAFKTRIPDDIYQALREALGNNC